MSKEIPEVEESTKFNFFTSIWIVPFIALFIASWLAYQYYSELGPEIKITFLKNEGLKAGQSQIKYKDVPIGLVEKIMLAEDGDGVVVTARMDKSAKAFLNQKTQFWIVKPEFGLSGVRGLDTLISGTYISMDGKKGGEFKDRFIGVDHSLLNNLGGGQYYVLKTAYGVSSVRKGTPVYFKNIRVGQVEHVLLDNDNIFIDVIVYIDKEFTRFVNKDSKFWTRSSLDMTLKNGSLDINVAPITDLLNGAIEFSSPMMEHNSTLPEKFTFILHPSKSMVNSKRIGNAQKEVKLFMLHTKGALSKLRIGSNVEYLGFKIGSVIQISLYYDNKTHNMNGEVLVEVDTSVFADPTDSNHTGQENLYRAVEEGMRAHIVSIDPITNRLYVDLQFTDNDDNKSIGFDGKFATLPTIDHVQGNAMENLNGILEKINALPLDKLVASLDKVINETSEPIANANEMLIELKKSAKHLSELTSKKSFERMPDEVDKALKELTKTLKTTKKVVAGYGNDSMLNKQLSYTLEILTKTSKEMEVFLRMLNRKPNSLIFGD